MSNDKIERTDGGFHVSSDGRAVLTERNGETKVVKVYPKGGEKHAERLAKGLREKYTEEAKSGRSRSS